MKKHQQSILSRVAYVNFSYRSEIVLLLKAVKIVTLADEGQVCKSLPGIVKLYSYISVMMMLVKH